MPIPSLASSVKPSAAESPLGIAVALVALLDADPATLGTTLDRRALAYLEQNLMAADDLPAVMARVECGDLLAAYVGSGKLLVSRRRVRRLADLDASKRRRR